MKYIDSSNEKFELWFCATNTRFDCTFIHIDSFNVTTTLVDFHLFLLSHLCLYSHVQFKLPFSPCIIRFEMSNAIKKNNKSRSIDRPKTYEHTQIMEYGGINRKTCLYGSQCDA